MSPSAGQHHAIAVRPRRRVETDAERSTARHRAFTLSLPYGPAAGGQWHWRYATFHVTESIGMSRHKISAGLALTLAGAAFFAAAPAQADPAFTPDTDDVVGVGSDTTMLAMDNVADGKNGIPGYNEASGAKERLVSWDAVVGDVSPTIVPRAGATEIARPNGSGAGKNLLYGSGNNTAIDYARSSSALNSAEAAAGLYAFPFALDRLQMAVSGTVASNAPATLTADQIVKIYNGTYTNWSQLGGTDGAIVPLIPQSGSGTRSFFEGQLKAANNGTAVTLAPTVKETQEHDPADIQNNPNAVAPFSVGRAKLAGTAVKLESGWEAKRAVYNVVRSADRTNSRMVKIFGTDGFLCSPQAKELIALGGLEQLASVANGGVCGEATQGATSNFTTNDQQVATTTSTLAVATVQKVAFGYTATATVTASDGTAPRGTVQFWDGGVLVKTVVPVSGKAVYKATAQRVGTHKIVAKYVPADGAPYTGSTSAEAKTVVRGSSATSVKGDFTITRTTAGRYVVTVKRTDTAFVKPTGQVNALLGTKKLTGGMLDKYGRVTLTLPKMSAGKKTVTFKYYGDFKTLSSYKKVTITVS